MSKKAVFYFYKLSEQQGEREMSNIKNEEEKETSISRQVRYFSLARSLTRSFFVINQERA